MRISLHFPSATGWQSILSHSIYDVSFESKTPPAPIERFILEWFMNCQGTRQDSPNLRYRKLMWEIVEYGLPTTTLCIRDYKKWNPIWESHFQPTSCNKKDYSSVILRKPPFFSQPFWSVWNEIGCYGRTGKNISQETYSYYGPLNRLAYNVGYHNVPGTERWFLSKNTQNWVVATQTSFIFTPKIGETIPNLTI